MKKNVFILLLLSVLLIKISGVNASTCTYSEQAQLNKDVANIKVTYEEKTGKVDPSLYECQGDSSACDVDYNYFGISVSNMTEDFYITVKNNIDNSVKTYRYSDAKDGIISFDWEQILNITTFTIDVYSSTETGCPRENYRTIYLTTPRKNPYHYYGQCQRDPEYYLCQKYVTFADMTFYEFAEKMEARAESIEEEKSQEMPQSIPEKVLDFISDNLIWVITGAVVAAGGVYAVTILIRKKRKKSVL